MQNRWNVEKGQALMGFKGGKGLSKYPVTVTNAVRCFIKAFNVAKEKLPRISEGEMTAAQQSVIMLINIALGSDFDGPVRTDGLFEDTSKVKFQSDAQPEMACAIVEAYRSGFQLPPNALTVAARHVKVLPEEDFVRLILSVSKSQPEEQ